MIRILFDRMLLSWLHSFGSGYFLVHFTT